MARKYSKSAGTDVKREMHRFKKGKAKSGKGGKVRQGEKPQAGIAIGLSKARKKGKKVPKKIQVALQAGLKSRHGVSGKRERVAEGAPVLLKNVAETSCRWRTGKKPKSQGFLRVGVFT